MTQAANEARVAEVAAGLNGPTRSVVVAICGNAWEGAKPTPGILLMNALELIHIDGLKSLDGGWVRFKAKPTPLGKAVHALLSENPHAD